MEREFVESLVMAISRVISPLREPDESIFFTEHVSSWIELKPYSPIHGFHSLGTSAGLGPGRRAIGDCANEEYAKTIARETVTTDRLFKRMPNL